MIKFLKKLFKKPAPTVEQAAENQLRQARRLLERETLNEQVKEQRAAEDICEKFVGRYTREAVAIRHRYKRAKNHCISFGDLEGLRKYQTVRDDEFATLNNQYLNVWRALLEELPVRYKTATIEKNLFNDVILWK